MSRNAIIDGFDFAANGFVLTECDIFSRAPLIVQRESLAVADGSIEVTSRYGSKPLSLKGYIRRSTRAELDEAMDQLNLRVSRIARTVDITHGNSLRRFIATVGNVSLKPSVTVAEFDMSLTAPGGFGSDLTAQTLIEPTAITSGSYSASVSAGGSFKVQPNITINLTSFTTSDIPPQFITVRNPDNSSFVRILREFEAGQTISINCVTKKAFVNFAEVPTQGNFPYWQPGSIVVQYLDDFDTRAVSMSASYTRRYA